MKTALFGSAEIRDYSMYQDYVKSCQYVICCDGGMVHAKRMGLTPDMILGDFDSVPPEILQFYENEKIGVRRYPPRKDFTDMELGITAARELGSTELLIFGGIGSRMDHTIANIHLLLRVKELGMHGQMIDEHNRIELIERKKILYGEKGDLISLLPFQGPAEGVSTVGLEYPLYDECLPMDSARGVSNVMKERQAEVTVKKGMLLLIRSRD